MAQVTLPLGYPLLSGLEGEVIVFQGTVARMYTVPKDPRTESQVFERKFLSDVAKMRGSAGAWARGVWKVSFGSKWGTIIYQMVKGDVIGYWSARDAEWESFSDETKLYLALEAPFRVTFNDPGWVWWCLYGMLYDWANAKGFEWWGMPEPDETYLDNMFEWWRAALSGSYWYDALISDNDYEQASVGTVGTWAEISHASASGGSYLDTSQVYAKIAFTMIGRYADIVYTAIPTGWYMDIFIDGVQQFAQINQRDPVTVYQRSYLLGPFAYGVHRIELRFWNGGNPANHGTFDAVHIRRTKAAL